MRAPLLIDLLSYTGDRGGTETYAREVVTRLPQYLPDTPLIALVGRTGFERVADFFPGTVERERIVGGDRISWALGETLRTTRVARKVGAGAIWCPANFGPITSRVPRVTTVHDVTYHLQGGSIVSRVVARATAALMSRTARTSTAVITGSRAAEETIVEHIGIPRAIIDVIPHGTRPPSVVSDPDAVVARLGVPAGRQIVLSTGNHLPHKNFEGLVAALAAIPADRRPLLVVTGGNEHSPVRALVTQRGLDDDVLFPGWVSSEQLEALYAVADLYVCPSLSEGFGLPVIDAQIRGCIVLANDIPVLREVGGDAARYVDATDPAAFGRAILDALADPGADERRIAGREHAATFTWDASAKRTAEVISRVLRKTERG